MVAASSPSTAIEVNGSHGSSNGVKQRQPSARRKIDRSESTASSSSGKQTHSHLGLRPKASDSLHTRLRTAHPRPKHVSKIEDVTSPRLKAPLRLERQNSSDSRIIGTLSSRNSERGSSVEADGALASDEPEGSQEMTTDIGIYDEAVYDQYLGPKMGLLRRRLIKSLHYESPLLAKHQTMVRTPRLDRYFVYTSLLGTHSFFLIFLPMAFWLGNARFARGLVNVLAFGVYASSAVKDALCIPRPFSPPVTRLVVGTTHLEYGFLSTHSTNSVSIAVYLYLWIMALRAEGIAPTILQSVVCEVALLHYVVSVVYGRIYCGMHSVMDCVMGCVLGAGISLLQWYCFDIIESFTTDGGWAVPITIIVAGLIMVTVHPQPLDDCPCFEDAIAFISVVMGVQTGRWACARYGLLAKDDNPLRKAGRGGAVENLLSPAKETIKATFHQIDTPTYATRVTRMVISIILKSSKLVFGVAVIMAVRLIVKTICRVVLPPVFRFVQGNLGLVLPRRHYKQTAAHPPSSSVSSSTTGDTPRKRPTHKRQNSSAGGDFFSNTSDPREYDSVHWKADIRSSREQSQDRAQQQVENQARASRAERAERSKVKFTLGDGKDIPIPFTHPNTHFLGDTFSERVAGALSVEEKERQQRELEKNFRFPTRQTDASSEKGDGEEEEEDFAHYDIDVLTKVFVYHAIGLTAVFLPAFFAKVSW